jgi:hypothetical protein
MGKTIFSTLLHTTKPLAQQGPQFRGFPIYSGLVHYSSAKTKAKVLHRSKLTLQASLLLRLVPGCHLETYIFFKVCVGALTILTGKNVSLCLKCL